VSTSSKFQLSITLGKTLHLYEVVLQNGGSKTQLNLKLLLDWWLACRRISFKRYKGVSSWRILCNKISLFVLRGSFSDIFDVLQEEIELYSVDGNVAVIGDLNGRVGKEPDFLKHDNLNRQLNDNIANFLEYVPDDKFCDRLTGDLKHHNTFGNRILQLCRSSHLRICNGRSGESSGKFTFKNKNGCSVIVL
jgi:hypothetical protein